MSVPDKLIESVVDENPGVAADFHDGHDHAINYLVGVVLQETAGNANPTEAENALREYLENRVVEVEIPYGDHYSFSEKASEIDGIPDTDKAHQMFKYCPQVSVTFKWDKRDESLTATEVEINGLNYSLGEDN